jgi:hypothetical protein
MHVCAPYSDQPRASFKLTTLPLESSTTPTTPSLFSSFPLETSRAAHRKSWICEPIREEPSNFELLPPFTGSESSEQLHKRHHRPRAPLVRTQSAPQLISTNTTQPIHIHNLRQVLHLGGCTMSSKHCRHQHGTSRVLDASERLFQRTRSRHKPYRFQDCYHWCRR